MQGPVAGTCRPVLWSLPGGFLVVMLCAEKAATSLPDAEHTAGTDLRPHYIIPAGNKARLVGLAQRGRPISLALRLLSDDMIKTLAFTPQSRLLHQSSGNNLFTIHGSYSSFKYKGGQANREDSHQAGGSEEQNPPSKKKATKEVAKAVKGKGWK